MYVVSWSLIEVQSNEKNDALAFNGCKGQKKKKKKVSPSYAVQHFKFAAMFKPSIHMTVFMNIILNQK